MKIPRLFFSFLILFPAVTLAQENFHSTSLPSLSKALLNDSLTRNLSAQSGEAKKAPTIGGAFMRSMLIPGWGQRRGGARTSARNFFVAEVLLWSSFAALEVYGGWQKNDYKIFSTSHAGAQISGKNDQFFVEMGNFISVEEYNQARLRRRDVEGLYDPATHFWRWDTDANRQKFFNMRKRSDKAYARAELVAAGVIANHIISGIHAAWVAHRNSSQNEKGRGEVNVPQLGVVASPEEIRVMARLDF
jgi:hypothetical protein